jgi:hypothetical protein
VVGPAGGDHAWARNYSSLDILGFKSGQKKKEYRKVKRRVFSESWIGGWLMGRIPYDITPLTSVGLSPRQKFQNGETSLGLHNTTTSKQKSKCSITKLVIRGPRYARRKRNTYKGKEQKRRTGSNDPTEFSNVPTRAAQCTEAPSWIPQHSITHAYPYNSCDTTHTHIFEVSLTDSSARTQACSRLPQHGILKSLQSSRS